MWVDTVKSFRLVLLVLLLSLLLPGICSAEKTYVITETQLQSYETALNQANQSLGIVTDALATSNSELDEVKKSLQTSKELIVTIQTLLQESRKETEDVRTSLKKSNNSLENANLLLDKYEKDTKAKIRKLELQNKLSQLEVILLGVAYVLK